MACAALSIPATAFGRSTWEAEIVYHIFPRSYRDSNGDRIGDLRGIAAGLDTIQRLGCTALLLAPIVNSRVYHNYFADDFFSVDQEYGSLDDFHALVRGAHQRHMKIILDVEPQYVADGHSWLRSVKADMKSPFAGYLWRQGPLSGDNILWYDKQKIGISPLDLDNPEVRAYVERIVGFWAEQGADGIRIDHMMDDLDDQHSRTGLFRKLWDPLERHLRRDFPHLFFVGEQADWGNGEEILHKTGTDAVFAFSLRAALLSGDKAKIESVLRRLSSGTPPGKTQILFLENHDTDRFASLEADPRRQRLAAALLLTLEGVPSIYYGQELGMLGKVGDWGSDGNHIPIRLAYRWTSRLDGPGTATWYRDSGPWWNTTYSSDGDGISLEEQEKISDSLFNFYRRLIRLRRTTRALIAGGQRLIKVKTPGLFAFERSAGTERVLVLANLTDKQARADLQSRGHLHDLWSGAEFAGGVSVAVPPFAFRLLARSNVALRRSSRSRRAAERGIREQTNERTGDG